MKFILKEKFKKKKQSKHLFKAGELVYQGENNLLHRLDLNILIDRTITIEEDLTVRQASFVNENIVFYDKNDRQFFLDKKWADCEELYKGDKKIRWLPFDVGSDDINFLPLYSRESFYDMELGFLNIDTKDIIWFGKVGVSKIIVFKTTCLVRRPDELKEFSRFSKFDLTSGELIWDFNTKTVFPDMKRGYMNQILGIHNNHLLLQPGGDRIIRLDFETGKVISSNLSFHQNFEIIRQVSPDVRDLSKPKMDGKGILEGFFARGMIYYTINEENEVKQLNNFRPGFPQKHEGWTIRAFELDDEKLVFTGTKTPGAYDTVGIIDRNSREIVWTYILEKNEAGYRISFKDDIFLDGQYICVSDTEDNIYIFEKDN